MSIWATTLSPVFAPQTTEAVFPSCRTISDKVAAPTVRRYMPGAPEIYISKAIDNSRLVRVADKAKSRDIAVFTVVMCVFCLCAFLYVLQHLASIQYGYNIEQARSYRNQLLEVNKTLRLEEASLKDPERIDAIARSMGMQMPVAGQVQHLEMNGDLGAPVMARAAGISVISLTQ